MTSDNSQNSIDTLRPIDRVIELIDASLRTLTGSSRTSVSAQEFPKGNKLNEHESQISSSLMRVNHTGEVCAQGLYEGQAFVARDPSTRLHLRGAAAEEVEHLNWCRMRLRELSSSESIFSSVFFLGAVGIGALTGAMGDKISLGFVEATEDEVRKHIENHLEQLPEADDRSRAILDKIREDEIRHGSEALDSGGVEFPRSVKQFMTLMSKFMTITTRHI